MSNDLEQFLSPPQLPSDDESRARGKLAKSIQESLEAWMRASEEFGVMRDGILEKLGISDLDGSKDSWVGKVWTQGCVDGSPGMEVCIRLSWDEAWRFATGVKK